MNNGLQGEKTLAAQLEDTREFISIEPYGQGTFSKELRDALREKNVLIRWSPDIVAVKDNGDVIMYDAKVSSAAHRDSPNVTVEINAVMAAHVFTGLVDSVFFVFDCEYMATPAEIMKVGRKMAGSNCGSGTPFYLVKKDSINHFSTISGKIPNIKQLPLQ